MRSLVDKPGFQSQLLKAIRATLSNNEVLSKSEMICFN